MDRQPQPRPGAGVAFLLLLGGAYGITLLGTPNELWGIVLIALPILKIRTVLGSLHSFLYVGTAFTIFLLIMWAIQGRLEEQLPQNYWMWLCPALLLLVNLLGKSRGGIFQFLRRLWYRIRY